MTDDIDIRSCDPLMVGQEAARRLRLAADANDVPHHEAATMAIERSLRHHEQLGSEK